jgi:hypothetical protein
VAVKSIALAIALGVTACAGESRVAGAPGVRVWESQTDEAITEGDTTLAVAPETAYAATVDYPTWTAIFPDITAVMVTEQNGAEARVTFVHRDGNRDNVHFRNRPQQLTVWFEDTGGKAQVWAEIAFLRGDRRDTARVHTRLYADVHGLASLFVSDAHLRSLREQRVISELARMHAYFATYSAVARGTSGGVGSPRLRRNQLRATPAQ